MENIRNKVIIITGASSGIGEATAKLLAENGAKIVLATRREERLHTIVDEIKQGGRKAVSIKADVAFAEDMQNVAELCHGDGSFRGQSEVLRAKRHN